MTTGPAKMPGGAGRLWRMAVAVSLLAALYGCAGGAGVGGSTDELATPPESETPAAAEVERALNRLSRGAKLPEPFSFGGAVATCKALGCPVPDAVHVNHVHRIPGRLDFSGFDFIEQRRSVSLATKSQSSGTGDYFISRRTLGGWMKHGFFLVETLHEGRHAEFSYKTYYSGHTTSAKPSVSVSGTWSGVMAGVIAPFSDDAGAFIRGDATVTVAYLSESSEALVDVEFTSITREDTGARLGNMIWENLALEGGNFAAGNVLHDHGDGYLGTEGFHPSRRSGIFGQFYGPKHEEVGGLFHRDGLAGAFGASRGN